MRNEFLAYRVLHPGDGPDLAVLLNVSAEPATADLHGRPARYLLGSDDAPAAAARAVSGTVPGHGWAILELAREAPE